MNSVYALQMSKAVCAAEAGGDFIDHGWSLVKKLHEAGFDIVPRDRRWAGRNPARTLNEMCGLRAHAEEGEPLPSS